MSYNGSGTFQINTTGQPVVTGTVISSTAFNALTADLATGLSTAITKDGQTATTARIPFAQGITSTLTTDATSTASGSIITAGGVGIAKALNVGTTVNVGSTTDSSSTSTGSIVTAGGLGVAKAAYIGTTLNVASTTTLTGVATLTANPVLSAGTINGVTYLNGSKSLTSGSALTFDGTNFATTGTATATKLIPTGTSVTGNGMYLPAANALGLSTNGTNAVYIDSSQNVGVGTSSPGSKFQVAGGRTLLCANSETFALGVNYNSTTGSYYIGATNSATPDMVFSQVGGTERLRLTDAGNLLFNSGYGSVATAYGCRAWVNFSGVGSTTIKGSGNVSSVTYVSTGKYTVNFSTALTDANYALTLGVAGLATSGGGRILVENSSGSGGTIGRTASAVTVLGAYSFSNPGSGTDDNAYSNSVAVFR